MISKIDLRAHKMQAKKELTGQLPDLLVVLFLLFSYAKIHLSIPGFGIPYFFAHIAAALYLNKYGYLKFMATIMVPWCIFLSIHFLISSANAPIPEKGDIQIFIYNLLNMFSLLALFVMLRSSSMFSVEYLARILMLSMLLLGFVEIYGGAKDIFDSIRELYTSEYTIYTAEDRDMSLYGTLRPSVFTSEPSSVGNFFGSLWVLYISISKRTIGKFLECAILMLFAIFLFRSPTLFVYIIVGIVINMYVFGGGRAYIPWTIAFFTLFMLIFAPYYLNVYGLGFLDGNEFAANFTSSGSFYIRQVAPVENFFYMLRDNPFFGYGYSYFEQIKSNNWVELTIKNRIFYDYDRISEMHGGQFITNAFWEFWILNGMLGGVIMLLYIWVVMRKIGGVSFKMLTICSACVWVSHAGVSLIFTWLPVIFIAYALSVQNASKKQ